MFSDECYREEQCKVCNSHNKKYYEDLKRRNGYGYRRLSKRAKELGEDISYQSFYRHFRGHYADSKPIEGRPKRGKFRIIVGSYGNEF